MGSQCHYLSPQAYICSAFTVPLILCTTRLEFNDRLINNHFPVMSGPRTRSPRSQLCDYTRRRSSSRSRRCGRVDLAWYVILWTKSTNLLCWRISLLRWRISLLRWRISLPCCTFLSYADGFFSYAAHFDPIEGNSTSKGGLYFSAPLW